MNESTSTKKYAWLWWVYIYLVVGVLTGLCARSMEAAGIPDGHIIVGMILVSLLPLLGVLQDVDMRWIWLEILAVMGGAFVASHVPNWEGADGMLVIGTAVPIAFSTRALLVSIRVPWRNAPLRLFPLWAVNNIPTLGMCVLIITVLIGGVVSGGPVSHVTRQLERSVDVLVLWCLIFLCAATNRWMADGDPLSADNFK